MNLENRKIIIVEGVPGAGKTTLKNELKQKLSGQIVYEYDEQEMLFSWKHGWIKDIDTMRLQLHERFLGYVEEVTSNNKDAVFLLDRFHLSYILYTKLNDEVSEDRYKVILERLKRLNALVVVPILANEVIEERAKHIERKDPVWNMHLDKRLKQKGFDTIGKMYQVEQEKIKELLDKQGLDYELV